jgi:hypothetical protein
MEEKEIKEVAKERYCDKYNFHSVKDTPGGQRILSRSEYVYGFDDGANWMKEELESQLSEKEAEMIKFSEWAGYNYIRLHGVWVGKYLSQLDKENHRTTEQLLEIFRKNNL